MSLLRFCQLKKGGKATASSCCRWCWSWTTSSKYNIKILLLRLFVLSLFSCFCHAQQQQLNNEVTKKVNSNPGTPLNNQRIMMPKMSIGITQLLSELEKQAKQDAITNMKCINNLMKSVSSNKSNPSVLVEICSLARKIC